MKFKGNKRMGFPPQGPWELASVVHFRTTGGGEVGGGEGGEQKKTSDLGIEPRSAP